MRRIVNELQVRGYRTWFDLDNMKGSTVDAMSGKYTRNPAVACDESIFSDRLLAITDAVDNAVVMLSGISLAYKESASKHTYLSAVMMHAFCAAVLPVVSYCTLRCLRRGQTVGLRLNTATSRIWS